MSTQRFSSKIYKLLLFSFISIQAGFLPSHAGPPLSIEDPGILEQGQWEIITAATATSIGAGKVYQFPVADVSLGVVEDKVQISAVYPYVFAQLDDQDKDSDFGNLELGVKFKVWDSASWQVAVAPAYSFGITRSLAETGIGVDTHVL